MDSERHDAQRSLYQLAFENSRDATLVVDVEGGILIRNRAAQALPEEWLDRFFAGRPRSPEAELFRRELAAHGHAHVEAVVGRRTVVLDGRGEGPARVVTVRDVTECRELETELRDLRRFETIGHLTAGLAHDFNNLLAPILSLSACLETE